MGNCRRLASAHDAIYLSYDLQCPKIRPKTINYRDLKRLDITALTEDALKLPWETVWTLRTVDEKIDFFNNLI